VGDSNGLATAINAAIQTAGTQNTGAAAAFKAAGISATIVTDASGKQKLAFASSDSSFQVQSEDRVGNALMGNFGLDGTTGATGAQMGTTVHGNAQVAATAGRLFSANTHTITITGAAMADPLVITLNTDLDSGANDLTDEITNQLGASGISVLINGGTQLEFASTNGAISVSGTSTGADLLGLKAAGPANGTTASANIAYSDFVAAGSSEMASSASGTAATTNFAFTAITGTQAVTVSANDASGTSHPKTITLDNTTSATDAAASINDALQKSNDSTLQQVTAVVVNENGASKINFVSTLSNFEVSLGTATGGIVDGAGNQGTTTGALQVGASASADISTAAGAKTAVSALTAAVSALGTAQAAVGKGQNQLGYAIGLAQSQINNFSSAQAQIRDADVASEAANLTKAQVLQQASIAAMAQANSAPQAVLSLLRG
jgi:flagellin